MVLPCKVTTIPYQYLFIIPKNEKTSNSTKFMELLFSGVYGVPILFPRCCVPGSSPFLELRS